MATFKIEGDGFALDGKPIRLICGAMHYFRIVPDYWEDRLRKLRACGFNAVETYVAWNLHEPEEGRFVFEGMADVERFVRLAGELGLHVILRPSPYICAEWEFGGLPAWLLADADLRLRCSDPRYLAKVEAYYGELLPRLKPLLCTSGGPIVAMQIENEYGSYGNDKNYLNFLKDTMVKAGMDVPLFTSDGSEDYMLQGGTLPDALATLNFGSKPEQAFARLQAFRPGSPLVCMEYWNGWFDHWGDEHHVRGHEDVVDVLDRMLAAGASVNFYMFHGGTNFGFYNGANHIEFYEPTVTSYDYNALLSESGDPTDKYWAIREVIGRYAELPDVPLPVASPKRSYGEVRLTERASLFASFDRLGSAAVTSVYPETMEKLGQDYGFIWYETALSGPRERSEIILQEVRDRATVYLDGSFAGVVERWGSDSVVADVPADGAKLGILVENMGRINYGSRLRDVKGITEGVKTGAKLYNHFLFHWTIRTLPLNDLSAIVYERCETTGAFKEEPAFYRGAFEVDEPADTFLKLEGWTKGVAYVNGFNLGRYWKKGPQKTLYVPGPLLRRGINELVVFELHGAERLSVDLQDVAELG